MQNDNAITRLLYAILSQKCLKDIDWNAVAHNPILNSEITNGHAARMRYSRFKKQMDASTGTLPPATPRKPRKNRVEKTRSPKKEKKTGMGGSGIKTEHERERDEKAKGKEREERGVKSEYAAREGTGESLFSASASTTASMIGDRDGDTPELEGGMIPLPSPAASLAQHDLSSGLGVNFNPGQPEHLHFHNAIQIKRERKPSANTLHSGLYGHSQSHAHAHSHHKSPLRVPHHLPGSLEFEHQRHQQHVTSSVSNSTLPSTPRMCIEEHENDHGHGHMYEHEHGDSPTHSSHSQSHYTRHLDAEQQDSFGLASLDNDDMDELMHSFEMGQPEHGHGHGIYSPLMSDGAFAFGMGSPGGMGLGMGSGGDLYDEFWNHNHGQHGGESERMGGGAAGVGGTVVKKEERWEEGYRRV
ncbi:hypothetical protein BKA65DRAFT_25094 [Rhexocercosporidium sp. MPI-PUGE-AT-0058]|nr:hypothetical protein BKA65DRAFT_25094 [Rhexocercosporidium sp. MPI-PUGE-AT-0058]